MTPGGKHERGAANPALRLATARLAAAAVVAKAGAKERHGRHHAPPPA